MLSTLSTLALVAGLVSSTLDHSHVQGEVGLFVSNGEAVLHPTLSGRVAPTGLLAFELDLPLVATTGQQGSTVVGNVDLRALFRVGLGSGKMMIESGLGVAFGTASGNNFGDLATYALGNAMTGYRRLRQMSPGNASVYVPIRLEGRFSSGFFLRTQAAIDVLFSTNPDRGDPAVLLTWKGGPGFRKGAFEGSLKLGLAGIFPTSSGADPDAQVALVPTVRVYTNSKPFKRGAAYGQVALNVNLDEPFGFSFDDGRVWGLFFAFGYTFPSLN